MILIRPRLTCCVSQCLQGFQLVEKTDFLENFALSSRNIRVTKLHISKFMELGKGKWSDDEDDLVGLCEQFLNHLGSYDRILSLRRLKSKTHTWRYELVEIPRDLLYEARDGELEIKHDSSQYPKPGYCHIYDTSGNIKFQLYFDGGSERKLQIKNLNKEYCIVHVEWVFDAGD